MIISLREFVLQILLPVPVITLVLLVCLSVLGLIKDPTNNGIGLGICLLGLPVYLICVKWDRRPRTFQEGLCEYCYALVKTNIIECRISTFVGVYY